MPDNKKHHFVPRVYLKNFSSNEKSINLYNVAADKVILGAALKSQCYRDYFYGQDLTLEKALGMIEGVAAKLFRDIIGSRMPPVPESEDFARLVTFIVFQRNRTSQAARAIDEMLTSMMKKVISYSPKFEADIFDKVDIGVKEPAIHALKAANHTLPFAMDLACKLLIAKPGTDFITSDNPAVYYNQALEQVHGHQGIGTASKGLQIYFPISPQCMILLYDDSVYKVAGRRALSVTISEQSDMDQINTLLLANAEENIYFLNADRINLRAIKRGIKYRLPSTSVLHAFNQKQTVNGRSDILIHQGVRPKTGLALSFIKQLPAAGVLRQLCQSGVLKHPGLVRDPDLVVWVERWEKSQESGNKQTFYEYIASQ